MLSPNALLQNRYLVLRPLAQGGMGAVYLATDQRLSSTVALKETFFKDKELRRAFEREARLLNSLRHGALPHVTDYFAEGEGQFLVMQYIPGKDFFELLEERQHQPFDVEQVLLWADHLLDALEYIHSHEPPVIHRDIKPHNLKLTPRGDVVLLDFGLAKGTLSGLPLVSASVRGYTPQYAPLEQIQGKGTDPRSDLYSLAATLHHMLTGQTPLDAISRAAATVNGEPDPLRPAHELNPKVPLAVAGWLYRPLSQNPAQRPATATLMRRELLDLRQAALARGRVTAVGIDPWQEDAATVVGTPDDSRTQQMLATGLQTQAGGSASLPNEGAARMTELSSASPTVTSPDVATLNLGRRGRLIILAAAAFLMLLAVLIVPRLVRRSSESLPSTESRVDGSAPASPPSAVNAVGSSGPASKLASSVVEFRVITVDEKGAITTAQEGHASSLEEDLSGVPLRMISISAGTYKMGASSTEQSSTQERPDHEVKVSGFLLGQTEVTQAQWRAVAGGPKVRLDLNPDPSRFKGAGLPVENVSWDEALEFCQRLARKTGRAYRLPSEAEWEYACRAGTTTPFHIGATLSPEMANYDGNSPYGSGPKGRYLERTAPVGQYKVANAFGLYDMHGNVWEWAGDVWHNSYRGAPTDSIAWEVGEDPNYRVIRGGSWFNSADECRSASRSSAIKDARYQRVGLRVALTTGSVN